MKKGISFILMFALLLTSSFSYGTSLEIDEMSISEKQDLVSEGIVEFENYFEENNIDIVEQLNLAKNELLELAKLEKDDKEVIKLKKLADSYD